MADAGTVPIPTSAGDVTAGWLTAAIGAGGSITAMTTSPIGTGQIADSIRFELTWEPPDAGPPSVVVKVTSSAEASRNAARSTRTYEVEVGFYRDLAPTLDVHKPNCYWAGHDGASNGYAVVLEDMAPAYQGDQMAGCSIDEASLALREAALLHGARWGDESLASVPWLGSGLSNSPGMAPLIQSLATGYIERYGDRLRGDAIELISRYHNALAASSAYEGPRTVVHNDFRNDNLLFGAERVCVLDWQTVSTGPGVLDVSYFLGGSLLPDDRAKAEDALVREYHERLRAAGAGAGADLSWDECWEQYRRYAFAGLTMAIVASAMVVRTDRGDDMFIAMGERAAIHAIDMETEKLLAG
jgi:hypothetical protein